MIPPEQPRMNLVKDVISRCEKIFSDEPITVDEGIIVALTLLSRGIGHLNPAFRAAQAKVIAKTLRKQFS